MPPFTHNRRRAPSGTSIFTQQDFLPGITSGCPVIRPKSMPSEEIASYKPTSRYLSARCPTGLLPNRRHCTRNLVRRLPQSVSDVTAGRQERERAGDFPALSIAPLIPRLLCFHTTFAIGAYRRVIALPLAGLQAGVSAEASGTACGHFQLELPSHLRCSRLARQARRSR